jgi:hypothetical protein
MKDNPKFELVWADLEFINFLYFLKLFWVRFFFMKQSEIWTSVDRFDSSEFMNLLYIDKKGKK